MYRCKYATLGCAHVTECNKQFYAYQCKTECGYYAYFKYLDENFEGKPLQKDEKGL